MTLDDFEAWKLRFLKIVKFSLLNEAQHRESDLGPEGARKINADDLAKLKKQKMLVSAKLGRLKCAVKRQAIDSQVERLDKEIFRFTALAKGPVRHGPKPMPERVALEIVRFLELANWEPVLLDKLHKFLFAGEFLDWLKASYQKSSRTAAAEWPIRLPTVRKENSDWASRLKEELLRSITGQRKLKGWSRSSKYEGESPNVIIFPREQLLEMIRQEGTKIFYEDLPNVTVPHAS